MHYLLNFLPICLFVILYVGSGIYFTLHGTGNAFYQLPPNVAIIPAIALGWWLYRGTTAARMQAFLDGVRHRDIITMCIVFLLAGAFSTVTAAIGSVDSTVNLALSLVPGQYLLIGLFLISAFISTAIGTAMGTIATLAPIAAGMIAEGAFAAPLGIATVVGGAMFGDNLSPISDTTIAAVMSQDASLQKKLQLNAKIAVLASLITMACLFFLQGESAIVVSKPYSLILLSPYLLLIALAVRGVNVFIVLTVSLAFAGLLGVMVQGYSLLTFSQDIAKGFASMQEIMLLSLMVGGLSGLASGGMQELATKLSGFISKRGSQRMAQLVIAKLVSVFDILLANNTVAIIFSGEMAKTIAKEHRIPAHYSAVWLDTFSCVFQGLIPYGAQILLASAIAGVSPLSISLHVYYCFALGAVALLHILLVRIKE